MKEGVKEQNTKTEELVSKKHQEKITKHLDEMYANENGKKFVLHLVRSYLPLTKISKIWDKPESGQCRCGLCRTKLFSIEEAFEGIQSEQFKEDFFAFFKNVADGNAKIGDHPIVKWKENRVLGFEGTNTTTFMCMSCVKVFFDWAVNKILKGDKTINWIMNRMQKDQMITHIEEYVKANPTEKNIEQAKSAKKVIDAHNDSNYKKPTFGDIQALQDLYKKISAEENSKK